MTTGDTARLVVVTGMSGAGKSLASNVLEDFGYFVVDNLPPNLLEAVVSQNRILDEPRSLAVVADSRGGLSFQDLESALNVLDGAGVRTTVLFLDADDETLVRRYEENRRPHPVGANTLGESIAMERKALEGLRGEADVVIDTSDRNVHELRQVIEETFTSELPTRPMRVSVTSFGFKRGVPRVLDLLFDVRFLPNPYWVPELRPLTGLDRPVADFVFEQADAVQFMDQVRTMLEFLLPRYLVEGKSFLSIGIGCTGGNHRSVAIAEAVGAWLADFGVGASVYHRDARQVTEATTTVDPLLEELEASFEGPAVVAIGGGHGLAQVLAAVQGYAGPISAVVGVHDDGGSSGRLALPLGIPPPGDIRRCLRALTPEWSMWRDLFDHRFREGDVAGHSLGNLILAALTDITGDFEQSVMTAEMYLGSIGQVIPVAATPLRLEAVIDGRVVEGQAVITARHGEITRLRVLPDDAAANPRALDAIRQAAQVIIGPGSLYTSLIAPLVVPGLADAINESSARLVYVANLTTQDGETLGMNMAGHVGALIGLSGLRPPDAVLANTRHVAVSPPVGVLTPDTQAVKALGVDVVAGAALAEDGAPRHDTAVLGDELARLATA